MSRPITSNRRKSTGSGLPDRNEELPRMALPPQVTGTHLRSFLSAARRLGLSIGQAEALIAIDEFRCVTVGTLAGHLKNPSTGITHMADGLVRLGYIDRRHDTDDRRRVMLEILPSGAAAVERILLGTAGFREAESVA